MGRRGVLAAVLAVLAWPLLAAIWARLGASWGRLASTGNLDVWAGCGKRVWAGCAKGSAGGSGAPTGCDCIAAMRRPSTAAQHWAGPMVPAPFAGAPAAHVAQLSEGGWCAVVHTPLLTRSMRWPMGDRWSNCCLTKRRLPAEPRALAPATLVWCGLTATCTPASLGTRCARSRAHWLLAPAVGAGCCRPTMALDLLLSAKPVCGAALKLALSASLSGPPAGRHVRSTVCLGRSAGARGGTRSGALRPPPPCAHCPPTALPRPSSLPSRCQTLLASPDRDLTALRGQCSSLGRAPRRARAAARRPCRWDDNEKRAGGCQGLTEPVSGPSALPRPRLRRSADPLAPWCRCVVLLPRCAPPMRRAPPT